jgi:NCAIR mutase (PurE)-related protein
MEKANNKKEIFNILKMVQSGAISPKDAIVRLQTIPFKDLGVANIDYHRGLRQGYGEVIFGQGKTQEQIANIVLNMIKQNLDNIIITRISKKTVNFLKKKKIDVKYHIVANIAIVKCKTDIKHDGSVVIVSGGTSDIPICEEAAITAETLGSQVTRVYDVGVAGIHRLLSKYEIFAKARVIIAVAGMEGALASVVGGLVSCPVIAVPTSIGYGSNFKGLSALLAMLNSCANGISVVNIDNGFGAGFIANRINKMESIK